MPRVIVRLLLIGVLSAIASVAAAQETGTVSGTVQRADGGAPLVGVTVTISGLSRAATTSESGRYAIRGVPEGSYTLRFEVLGYERVVRSVTVSSGSESSVDVELRFAPIRMSEIRVNAASRTPERVVEAPAAISVVDPALANDMSVTAQVPRALATLAGVEVAESGVFDFNVNTRGFNSSLTRRMLVLQDGRDLSVPLLGFQEWAAFSVPMGDFQSVEVVRGPGSALYGANAYSGVIDIRTWSPREVVGTKASVAAGELGTVRGDVRHAGVTRNGRFGYKMNLGYARSESWTEARTEFDGEAMAREYQEATDEPVEDVVEAAPLFGQAVDEASGMAIGEPDPVKTIYGSARGDYYRDDGSAATVEGGVALIENVTFVTGIGRIQVDEVLRPWSRVEWSAPRWSVSTWYSGRNTLEAPHRSLGSGAPVIDKSGIYHVETQTNREVSQSLNVVAGGSIRNTRTNTEETLFGADDDDRSDWTYSVYGQADARLSDLLDLVVAMRADDGNLYDVQVSPRVALVLSPNASHSVRLTASRAFQTPSQLERFLRVPAARPADFTALEAGLRASPLGPALEGVEEGELFTMSSSVPVLALGNRDLNVESVLSLEAGYKGQLGDGFFVTLDAYYSELGDFVTDLIPGANPRYGAWTAPEEVPEASRSTLEETVRAQLLAAGQPLAAAGLTRLGDGSTAIVVSYANAGEATEHGVEFGMTFSPLPELTLRGSYTYFEFDVDPATTLPGDRLTANSPRHKGSVAADYEGGQGWSGGVTFRMSDSFDWSAGVFSGKVPSNQIVDVRAGYRLTRNVRMHLVGTNIFDRQRFQLYGGSVIGRRVIAGLTVVH